MFFIARPKFYVKEGYGTLGTRMTGILRIGMIGTLIQ